MRKYVSIIILLMLHFQPLFAQKNNQENLSSKIDSLIRTHYQHDKPGMAISVIKEGKTIYTNQIGLENIEYETSITDSTAFHIASVSKQFTSFLAVLLEKEGKLSMDDDVRTYLTELKHLPYKITLKQLANHTHGLPNLFELAQLKGIGIEDRMTHQEVVKMLLNIKQVNFKPGDTYEYNNTGYALLAEVIERVSKKPFQVVLKNRVFSPLGMKNTMAISNSSIIIKNKARSYRLNNDEYENHDFNIMANGSSGVSTTINDLSKWAINFQQPSKLHQDLFQTMQKTTPLNSGEVIEYGLGLEFKKYKGLDLVFHGGGDAAYRSYILHIPKHQFSIVILANSNDFATLEITYNIIDLLFKEIQIQPLKPVKTKYTAEELKKFEGTYEFCPGSYSNIIAENDSLYFQSYGTDDKVLLPVIGDGDFVFPEIPTSKFSFYDNGFNFHIADFKYDCKKVKLNPPKTEEINLVEFTGLYKNKEFNTEYELVIENNQLVALHSFNEDILLYPLTKNSFYATEGFFGKLDFSKNNSGEIKGFHLSGQNIKNIKFRKIE